MSNPNQLPQTHTYETSFPIEEEPRALSPAELINGSASSIWLEQAAPPDLQAAIAKEPGLLDRLRARGQIRISRSAILEGAVANVQTLLDEPDPQTTRQLLDKEGPKYLRAIALTASSQTLSYQQLRELQPILSFLDSKIKEETFDHTNPHTGISHTRRQFDFVSDSGVSTPIDPNVLETAKTKIDEANVGQYILEDEERERLTRILQAQNLKTPPSPKVALPEAPGRIKKALVGEDPKIRMKRLNQEREHSDPDIPLRLTDEEIQHIKDEYFNAPGGSELNGWDENPSYLITNEQLLKRAQEVAKRKLDLDFAIRAGEMPLARAVHQGIARVALLETALPKPDVDSDLKEVVDLEVRRGIMSLLQGSVAEINQDEASDLVSRSRSIDREPLDDAYERTYRRSLAIHRNKLIRQVAEELEPLIASDQLKIDTAHLAQIGEWIGEESRSRAKKSADRSRRKAHREQEDKA